MPFLQNDSSPPAPNPSTSSWSPTTTTPHLSSLASWHIVMSQRRLRLRPLPPPDSITRYCLSGSAFSCLWPAPSLTYVELLIGGWLGRWGCPPSCSDGWRPPSQSPRTKPVITSSCRWLRQPPVVKPSWQQRLLPAVGWWFMLLPLLICVSSCSFVFTYKNLPLYYICDFMIYFSICVLLAWLLESWPRPNLLHLDNF
jgi:hypothetical protein